MKKELIEFTEPVESLPGTRFWVAVDAGDLKILLSEKDNKRSYAIVMNIEEHWILVPWVNDQLYSALMSLGHPSKLSVQDAH